MGRTEMGGIQMLSDFLGDLYRLQEPAGVLETVDRWARQLAPYDFAVPAFTDRPSGAVAMPGVPADFAAGYRRHAIEDAARLAHLAPQHPGAVRLSEVVPAQSLRRSPIWNELLHPNRIRHVMVTCLVETPRVSGVLKMIRVDGRDFSGAERDTVALAAPHVRLAYANAEAMAGVARQAARLPLVCDRIAEPVVLVTADGALLHANEAARTLGERYLGGWPRRGPTQGARLPDRLRRLVRTGAAQATLEGPDGVLIVRAARLEPSDRDGAVLLTLAERPRAISPLTPREREVVRWVGEGKTNDEIGVILGISGRTVQTHLEHVYEKLGVVSRAQAVTAAIRLDANR